MEETFSNLDFLQDLPEMLQFPSEDVPGLILTPQPELTPEDVQSIEPQDQLSTQSPTLPEEMQQKQPEPLQQIKGLTGFRNYFHENIAKPLIGPPEPGHTTFTIQLSDNKVSGFYQIPSETRSLKELGPLMITRTKSLLKSIKERDFKKDIKHLKNLPSTLKKTSSKFNVDAIKNIPKKIRALFSSD